MSQQDFANRLARLESKAPPVQEQMPQAQPSKRRWPLWVGLICVALGVVFFFVGTGKPTQTYDDIFTATSKPAFEGELKTVSYPSHDFQIDIPSDWREMTRDEVQAAGGSLTEVVGGANIADFTSAPVGETPHVRFDIFTTRTEVTDATTPVTEFQDIVSMGNMIGRFMGFHTSFLTAPTPVEHPQVSVAETTLFQQFPDAELAGLYRVYIVGYDLIVVYVTWEDTNIHPSAFALILDSFREL